MSKKRLSALTTALMTIIVLGIFVFQYLRSSQGDEAVSQQPPDPATVTVWPVTPVPASPSPSAGARPSSTPSVRPSSTPATKPGRQADFDFYVMSLSWSPDYYATSGNDDPQQCSLGKKLGFVLHGLWPQYERGYPEYCSVVKLTQEVKDKFPNLYPSASLYNHEWDKHGTCSGLTPEQYLSLSKKIKESVAVPAPYKAPEQPVRVTTAKFKQEFVAANPAMTADALAVYCFGSGRFLQELYVCFSREGQPIGCSKEVQDKAIKTCGNPDFLVRNVR